MHLGSSGMLACSFLVASSSRFGIRVMLALGNEFGRVPSSDFVLITRSYQQVAAVTSVAFMLIFRTSLSLRTARCLKPLFCSSRRDGSRAALWPCWWRAIAAAPGTASSQLTLCRGEPDLLGLVCQEFPAGPVKWPFCWRMRVSRHGLVRGIFPLVLSREVPSPRIVSLISISEGGVSQSRECFSEHSRTDLGDQRLEQPLSCLVWLNTNVLTGLSPASWGRSSGVSSVIPNSVVLSCRGSLPSN